MVQATAPSAQTIELRTGAVHVVTGGSGSPLVVLHHDVGPMGWTPLHQALAAGFTVYAPHLPGFGESPRAEWARHPRDHAAVMLAFARKLSLRDYALVGLGFGGWVAAEMAAFAHPEIAALVLAAPAGLKPDEGFILDQVMEEQIAYLRAGFSSAESFERHVPDPRDKALREQLDRSRETIARVSWKPYMYSYELPETLGEMTLPATVVWGREDRVIPPSSAAQWAAALPNCNVRLIDGAGHFLDLEAAEELATITVAAFEAATRKG